MAPIHELQYLFKAKIYTFHKVDETWIKIRIHLICMSIEYGIEKVVFSYFIKTVWQIHYKKQIQKFYLQVTFLVFTYHSVTMIRFISKAKFNKLMTGLFKRYTFGYKGIFF